MSNPTDTTRQAIADARERFGTLVLAADQDIRNVRSELSFDEAEALGIDGTGRGLS